MVDSRCQEVSEGLSCFRMYYKYWRDFEVEERAYRTINETTHDYTRAEELTWDSADRMRDLDTMVLL